MSERSLRLRLLNAAVLWSLGSLAAAGTLLAFLYRDHMDREYARFLVAYVEELAALVELGPGGEPRLEETPRVPRFLPSGLDWMVQGRDGGVRSPSLGNGMAALLEGLSAEKGRGGLRILEPAPGRRLVAVAETRPAATAASQPPPTLRFMVAGSPREFFRGHAFIDGRLAAALALLAVALMVAGALEVRRALVPVGELCHRLAAIRSGSRHRLDGSYPSEIQPLVDELNSLLAHGAAVVERARVEAGNLAHGLRTPLAVLANLARDLERNGDPEAAVAVAEQAASMQRHIDYQSARARSVASGQSLGVSCEIEPSVRRLVRTLGTIHHHRGIDVAASVPAVHRFRGERQDLEEMLGNLLDNACKWADRRVEVTCARHDGRVLIRVADDGPGLDPRQRDRVFQRGTRLDESTPGSGLGLAIVRELAELYDGSIALSESAMGGLRADLRLPAA